MIGINVRLDPRQVDDLRATLAGVGENVQRVLSRAINKVAVSARTQIIRRVAAEITVRPRELRDKNIRLRKADYRSLAARIWITGRRIPLLSFAARPTARGVSYAIRKGRRQVLAHAFIASMGSGHRGVMIRSGPARLSRRLKTGRGRGRGMVTGMTRPRLPISERFGPSVPQVVQDIAEFAAGVLERRIGQQLEFEVGRQVDVILASHGRGPLAAAAPEAAGAAQEVA